MINRQRSSGKSNVKSVEENEEHLKWVNDWVSKRVQLREWRMGGGGAVNLGQAVTAGWGVGGRARWRGFQRRAKWKLQNKNQNLTHMVLTSRYSSSGVDIYQPSWPIYPVRTRTCCSGDRAGVRRTVADPPEQLRQWQTVTSWGELSELLPVKHFNLHSTFSNCGITNISAHVVLARCILSFCLLSAAVTWKQTPWGQIKAYILNIFSEV